MGIINSLRVVEFRNIQAAHFNFSEKFNVVYGANGGGKTSLLEILYFITHGRSFRTIHKDEMVMHKKERFLISAIIDQHETIYIEKSKNREAKIKKNEKHISLLDLIKQFPIHIVNHASFKLLSDGPSERRKFVDWGLFHVEHGFYDVWYKFTHAMQQRNKLLRGITFNKDDIEIWNNVLIDLSQKLSKMRENYILHCNRYFQDLIAGILPYNFRMVYKQGWDEEYSYEDALNRYFRRDCKLGYTTVGPHRADIQIECDGKPVQAVLSNGQTKLLIFNLKMAQDLHMRAVVDKKCLYIVDDLSSELDLTNQKKLIDLLIKLETQVFLSIIDPTTIIPSISDENRKLFHVEQGVFIEK